MKELTNAEEQIMQVIWKLEKGFLKDIVDALPEPKPAYTTVATVIRILERKKFVSHRAYGKTHEYYPLVAKKEYSRFYFGKFLQNYFGGSFAGLVSFFGKEHDLSLQDMEALMKQVKSNENPLD